MGKPVDWRKYRMRRCYSLHRCAICGQDITLGEVYFDGGPSRRAHSECVEAAEATEGGES